MSRKGTRRATRSKKRKSKINWRVIGLGTLATLALATILVIIAFGYNFITTTPALDVKTVKITGNEHISENIVLAALNLRNTPNIFQVDLGDSSRTLEKYPWVKRAIIRRRLPQTLLIEIVEHKPIAIVVAKDFFYLSPDGELFKRIGTGEDFDLPVITGFKTEDLEKRAVFAGGVLGQAKDILIWSQGASSLKLENISEVNVDPVNGFSIYLVQSGTKIIIGKNNLIARLERLERVMEGYDAHVFAAKVVDLRFKERVVAQLK